ncbi:MAG: pyridoxamine kinase [Coprobacillus sp.]
MQRQKRIALINDITGFGRCATMAMAPIISAMKIQAVAVPTAILSANTLFEGYYFDDYTSRMNDYIQTYKDLDLEFDGIATGFIGSSKQIDIVIDFILSFKKENVFVLVDPVMGDHGKLYQTYTPEMCERMRELVRYADLMTPNLTELNALLNRPYPQHTPSREELHDMCEELSKQGPQHIVVTGISLNEKQIMNYIYNSDDEDDVILVERIGKDRCGTGDVIAAIIAGNYVKGHCFKECVKRATDFASQCITYCEETQLPNHYGLCFEQYLYELGKDE